MSTFITQECFSSLIKGDKLYGHGSVFEIELANCGGPGKHPTHMVFTEMNGGKELNYIFHNGKDILYRSKDNKDLDGSLVGELVDDGTCRVITRSESIQNIMRRSNLSLIGTGNYCPDCGGLCGNSNHTRKRW